MPEWGWGVKRLFQPENIFIFFGTPLSRPATIRVMFKPGIYQGRFLGETEIAQVRG
jgi:hypothetical protein